MAGIWLVGVLPGILYTILKPDGIAHPDRWSYGYWLQALKFTPLPHLASFFKSPMGNPEHDFFKQYAELEAYAAKI